MLCAAGMVASLPQVAFPGQSDVQVAEVVGVEQMARFGPPGPFGFGGRQYGGYGQRPITPAHLLAGLIGHATGITPPNGYHGHHNHGYNPGYGNRPNYGGNGGFGGNGNNYNNYNNNYNNRKRYCRFNQSFEMLFDRLEQCETQGSSTQLLTFLA